MQSKSDLFTTIATKHAVIEDTRSRVAGPFIQVGRKHCKAAYLGPDRDDHWTLRLDQSVSKDHHDYKGGSHLAGAYISRNAA